ncbi:MAG: hypothetical protein ACRDN9_13895 [Streptosporangiaceae bacterium]
MTLRFASAGLVVAEVASYERERLTGVSNLRTLADGARVVTTIVRERGRRRRLSPAPALAGRQVDHHFVRLAAPSAAVGASAELAEEVEGR